MSTSYVAVQWNSFKKRFDLTLAIFVFAYLAAFLAVGINLRSLEFQISAMILVMRAFGTCALILLHFILLIGPLARLSPKFKPLLYNRRHVGVVTFFLGGLHALLALLFYHSFGSINPLLSVLKFDNDWTNWRSLPFQVLGAAALSILFLLASTSHDFWNRQLGPKVWKFFHMLVYLAYGLLILHVTLGILHSEPSSVYPWMLGGGFVLVSAVHLSAAAKEYFFDRARAVFNGENWIPLCSSTELTNDVGKVCVSPHGERIALYKHKGQVFALENECAHQGGPIGEGRILDGCITCPWHGWQYRPEDGTAPPPFKEKLKTFRVRDKNGRIELDLSSLEKQYNER